MIQKSTILCAWKTSPANEFIEPRLFYKHRVLRYWVYDVNASEAIAVSSMSFGLMFNQERTH